MFAEDISEDFSEDRRYHFYWILECFWTSSKSSRKIAFFWEVFGSLYPLGFLPLSRFQKRGSSSFPRKIGTTTWKPSFTDPRSIRTSGGPRDLLDSPESMPPAGWCLKSRSRRSLIPPPCPARGQQLSSEQEPSKGRFSKGYGKIAYLPRN